MILGKPWWTRLEQYYCILAIIIDFLSGSNDVFTGANAHTDNSGEIILGGLFPIRSESEECDPKQRHRFSLSSFQAAQAMLHSIAMVNDDVSILRNVSLRAMIYDTCASQSIAASRTKEFIKMTIQPDRAGMQLAGVIGAAVSDVSSKVASILQVFEIPQISHASTSLLLSDKDIYSHFLRTVPPDSFQAQAMVDLCLKFGWKYVITVNSEGIYGTNGIHEFHKLASKNGICTDHIASLKQQSKKNEFDEVVEQMVKRSKGTGVSVVVLFCSSSHSYRISQAARENTDAMRFTWIASDAWDTTTTERSDVNVLVVKPSEGGVSRDFRDYFSSLNVYDPGKDNDTLLTQFWRAWFHCEPSNATATASSLPKCSGRENLRDKTISFAQVHSVVNAVYAFAHALHSLQKELCGNESGICRAMSEFRRERLLDHLKNVSFQSSRNTTMRFNENGEVNALYDILNFQVVNFKRSYVRVGIWDGERNDSEGKLVMSADDVRWHIGNTVPTSYCSSECPFGHIKKTRATYDINCCWTCHECGKLQIIVNNSCLDGPLGHIPNANKTEWMKRHVSYLKWSDRTSVILSAISSLCIILTLSTLLVYFVFRNHRTVKASGKELSYIILVGILMCFITPFLYIAKPNTAICYARKSSMGLALVMVYAALFMKINRVYRVFNKAASTTQRPSLVRPKSQILITCGLVIIQVLFTALWFIAKPVHAMETYYSDKEVLLLECLTDPVTYVGSLSYVLFLIILSTIYAFKTRQFPKNFNESKFIGITLYTTCAASMLFFAFFLNTTDKLTEDILIAVGSIILGLITLLGLFGQRVYVILFVRDIRVDDHFKLPRQPSSPTEQSAVIIVKQKPQSLHVYDVVENNIAKSLRRSVSF